MGWVPVAELLRRTLPRVLTSCEAHGTRAKKEDGNPLRQQTTRERAGDGTRAPGPNKSLALRPFHLSLGFRDLDLGPSVPSESSNGLSRSTMTARLSGRRRLRSRRAFERLSTFPIDK